MGPFHINALINTAVPVPMENRYTAPVTHDTLWLASTLGWKSSLIISHRACSKLPSYTIYSNVHLFQSYHRSTAQEQIFVSALTLYARIWYNYQRTIKIDIHKETSETASKPPDGLAQHDFCPGVAAAAYLCTVQRVMGVCCRYPAAAAFVHNTHHDWGLVLHLPWRCGHRALGEETVHIFNFPP